MSKRKLFWQTAKTINWSIIFQALSDLLLIALPTIVAALSGNMTQMLLEYDKEGIFYNCRFLLGRWCSILHCLLLSGCCRLSFCSGSP